MKQLLTSSEFGYHASGRNSRCLANHLLSLRELSDSADELNTARKRSANDDFQVRFTGAI